VYSVPELTTCATSVGAMRPEQPAVNQPIQKTVPGKDSADTPT
jgi:hypothetical protein